MASADEILGKMRALQQRREAAVGPLVELLAERGALLKQLAELDDPYGKAYVDAEAAGWTAEELQTLGADAPARRPRVRSKGRRTTPQGAAKQPPGTIPADGSPAAQVPHVPGQDSAFASDHTRADSTSD
ncbi:hypothetical protein [Streptomyces sp. NPDC004579]|uniref:hypothetical protein n=1 Tax=Streptomyces sp. NPDC004579 TaxID=3154667 RepID=UPI0033B3D756